MAERRALLGSILLGLVIAAARVGQSVVLALALARVFDGDSWPEIAPFLLAAVGLVALRAVATAVQGGAMAGASVRITTDLRLRLVRAILRLGPGWVARERSGELEAVIVDGVERLDAYFRLFLAKVVVAGITAATVVAVVIAIDPVVGLLVAGFALLVVGTPALEYRALGSRMRFWSESYRPLAGEFVDNLQGMSTLKMFGVARRRGRELFQRSGDLRDAAIRLTNVSGLFWGFMAAAAGAGVAAALAVGSIRMALGHMSGEQLLLVLLLAGECFLPARDIHDAMHLAVWGMSKVERAFGVLDIAPPISVPEVGAEAPRLEPAVRFENVRFRYRTEGPPALDGISFSIDPGETVAIVGASGAGKTTIASLLLRFFDPDEGTIYLGGRDIRTLHPDAVRSQIALVPQDTFLFHDTVRENILLADPSASDEELVHATRSSNAEDFIAGLPEGYQTIVGERGLRLSGGERQRIAIARALLKDASILVLDEATSNVDVAGEADIQASLEELRRGRTTLVIAHRLSTVREADRILVLDQGRLTEAGTHQELMGRRGRYASLVATQEEA